MIFLSPSRQFRRTQINHGVLTAILLGKVLLGSKKLIMSSKILSGLFIKASPLWKVSLQKQLLIAKGSQYGAIGSRYSGLIDKRPWLIFALCSIPFTLILLGAISSSHLTPYTGRPRFIMVSRQEAESLSQEELKSFLLENQVFELGDSHHLTITVRRIMDRLIRENEAFLGPNFSRPLVFVTTRLAATSASNASGSIHVSAGALSVLSTPSQVAALLAHELSHHICEHPREMLSGESFWRSCVGMIQNVPLLSTPITTLRSLTINWTYGLASKRLSVDHPYHETMECEADLISANLLVNAGYDPMALFEMPRLLLGQKPTAVDKNSAIILMDALGAKFERSPFGNEVVVTIPSNSIEKADISGNNAMKSYAPDVNSKAPSVKSVIHNPHVEIGHSNSSSAVLPNIFNEDVFILRNIPSCHENTLETENPTEESVKDLSLQHNEYNLTNYAHVCRDDFNDNEPVNLNVAALCREAIALDTTKALMEILYRVSLIDDSLDKIHNWAKKTATERQRYQHLEGRVGRKEATRIMQERGEGGVPLTESIYQMKEQFLHFLKHKLKWLSQDPPVHLSSDHADVSIDNEPPISPATGVQVQKSPISYSAHSSNSLVTPSPTRQVPENSSEQFPSFGGAPLHPDDAPTLFHALLSVGASANDGGVSFSSANLFSPSNFFSAAFSGSSAPTATDESGLTVVRTVSNASIDHIGQFNTSASEYKEDYTLEYRVLDWGSTHRWGEESRSRKVKAYSCLLGLKGSLQKNYFNERNLQMIMGKEKAEELLHLIDKAGWKRNFIKKSENAGWEPIEDESHKGMRLRNFELPSFLVDDRLHDTESFQQKHETGLTYIFSTLLSSIHKSPIPSSLLLDENLLPVPTTREIDRLIEITEEEDSGQNSVEWSFPTFSETLVCLKSKVEDVLSEQQFLEVFDVAENVASPPKMLDEDLYAEKSGIYGETHATFGIFCEELSIADKMVQFLIDTDEVTRNTLFRWSKNTPEDEEQQRWVAKCKSDALNFVAKTVALRLQLGREALDLELSTTKMK